MVGGAQIQVPVVAQQLQQVPDLFLSAIVAARVAADVPVRHLVAQPVPRAGNHTYLVGLQTHLLVQFPEHGLLRVFSAVYAALRELPAVGAYALAPEYLVSLVEQDDADVWAEAVPVEHNLTPIL